MGSGVRRNNPQCVTKLGEFPSDCCVVLSCLADWLFRPLVHCEKNEYSCVPYLVSSFIYISLPCPDFGIVIWKPFRGKFPKPSHTRISAR